MTYRIRAGVKSAFGIPPRACQLRPMPRWKARTAWIAGSLLMLQIGAVLGQRMWSIQRDLKRWEAYQSQQRLEGEDLGIKAWLPPAVADEDNLFAHPWMLGFMASEDSPQAGAVAQLRAWPELGFDSYKAPSEGQSWFDGREAEADATLRAGRERAADLEAIHAAAGRPACQPPVALEPSYECLAHRWTRVNDLGPLLELHADAAMASGDGAAATIDLEAMLRLGQHLRGADFLLATVIGAGFEARALPLVEAGLQRNLFRGEEKRRLLAAIRTRPLPEEMAAVMRVERGLFLATLERLNPDRPPAGLKERWANWLHPPERLVATNSLHFCQMLDAPLGSPGGRPAWEDFHQRVCAPSPQDATPGTALASAALALGNVAAGLFAQEDELDRIRQQLAE
jgi:hypothetical protein